MYAAQWRSGSLHAEAPSSVCVGGDGFGYITFQLVIVAISVVATCMAHTVCGGQYEKWHDHRPRVSLTVFVERLVEKM